MQTLDEMGLKYGTDKASSHHDYLKRYGVYFAPLRHEPVKLLEIGVQFGNSMRTWLDYFEKGEIWGIDIADNFKSDNPRAHFVLGDASNPAVLDQMIKAIPPEKYGTNGTLWDIVIDDGSHVATEQTRSFLCLWDRVRPGGFYVLEDVFTWYDNYFNLPGEANKLLTPLLSALNMGGKSYHGKPLHEPVPPVAIETEIDFIHCYPGVVIIHKNEQPRTAPI